MNVREVTQHSTYMISKTDDTVVFRPQYLPVLTLRILFNYLYIYAVVAPEK